MEKNTGDTPKVKKVNSLRRTKGNGNGIQFSFAKTSYIVIGLVITVALFLGLMYARDYLADDITYTDAVVCASDIPKGEIITESNCNTYFKVAQIPVEYSIDGSLTNVTDMVGCRATVDLKKGEIITTKDFTELNQYTDDITNPVMTSFEVSSIADGVGGSLRAGDVINITVVASSPIFGEVVESTDISALETSDEATVEETEKTLSQTPPEDEENADAVETSAEPETEASYEESAAETTENTEEDDSAEWSIEGSDSSEGSYSYILHDIYITEVRDSSGTVITNTDTESAATIIMIEISADASAALNEALNNGATVRVEKVLY